MQLTKCTVVAILLIALSVWSCKSPTKTMAIEKETVESRQQTDSVSLLIEKTIRPVTVAQTTAKISLTPEDLQKLPVGGQYQAKSGQATGTIKRTDKGFEFTANCDSLQILVTDLKTEVYRLKANESELKTQLKETKTIEVNKLTRWQKIRIDIANITIGILGVGALIGGVLLIRKFKKIV